MNRAQLSNFYFEFEPTTLKLVKFKLESYIYCVESRSNPQYSARHNYNLSSNWILPRLCCAKRWNGSPPLSKSKLYRVGRIVWEKYVKWRYCLCFVSLSFQPKEFISPETQWNVQLHYITVIFSLVENGTTE